MAELTVDGLGELTSPAANDEIGIWDVSAGQYLKIRRDTLVGGVITGGGTVATGGYTLTVRATGNAAIVSTGSWTPGVKGASGSGQSYALQIGRYLRILDGSQAWCIADFIITLSSKGTLAGGLLVSDFPFAAANIASAYFASALLLDRYTGGAMPFVQANPGSVNFFVIYSATAGEHGLVQVSEISNETTLRGSIAYPCV